MLAIQLPIYAKSTANSGQNLLRSANKQEQDVEELLSIPSYRRNKIKQPYQSLNDLYKAAFFAQYELENMARNIAVLTKGQVISSGLKRPERAREKIKKELANDVSHLTDISRVTIATSSIGDLNRAYQHIISSSKVMSVANRFESPRPSGYRDLKILIQLPETKLIAEIQLHLADLVDIKNNKEHDIYKKIQKIERKADMSARILSDIETARISRLHKKSRRLYEIAWQRYHFLNQAC